ncbi:hypothetical protein PMAYCL1PPCAC_04828, partial [Pristionchus mayeri]
GEVFDPDHPRYHHAGCCDAHVVTSARAVAIFALIASILRTLFMLEGWWERPQSWEKLKGASSLVEAICISLLLLGVFKDHGLLVLPYLIFQNFIVAHLLYLSFLELTGHGIVSEYSKPNLNDGFDSRMILIRCLGRISWTAVSAYFCYVLFNYLRFLKRKSAAFKDHERGSHPARQRTSNARQTIFEYQLSMVAPTNPSAQSQALIHQYQEFPCMQMFEPPPPYEPRHSVTDEEVAWTQA